MDSYERRIFLAMLGSDQRETPGSFGAASYERFQASHRLAATRLPVTCRCGYTTPGPFMEMHDCKEVGGDGE
jgi:hypothetical protein